LLAAQQQQQAAMAAGKPGMAGKHESQQAMVQRMYGAQVPPERSVISPPGLLSGRHAAAAAAPAGSEASAMSYNMRPMSGEPAGHPLSPDAMRDTASMRDTGAAAAAAYAAAEAQALAQQEQQVRQWALINLPMPTVGHARTASVATAILTCGCICALALLVARSCRTKPSLQVLAILLLVIAHAVTLLPLSAPCCSCLLITHIAFAAVCTSVV
jgi:hypothetical protein